MKRPKRTKKLEVRLFPEELDAIRKRYGRAAPDVVRRLLSGRVGNVPVPTAANAQLEALRGLAMIWADNLDLYELLQAIVPGNAEIDAAKATFVEHFNYVVNLWYSDSSIAKKVE